MRGFLLCSLAALILSAIMVMYPCYATAEGYVGIWIGNRHLETSKKLLIEQDGDEDPWGIARNKARINAPSPAIFVGNCIYGVQHSWFIAYDISLTLGKSHLIFNKNFNENKDFCSLDIKRRFGFLTCLKPGYSFKNNISVFGIIGVSLDNYKIEYSSVIHHLLMAHQEDFYVRNKKFCPGYVFGAGVEYPIGNVKVGMQVIYTIEHLKSFADSLKVDMKSNVTTFALYIKYCF